MTITPFEDLISVSPFHFHFSVPALWLLDVLTRGAVPCAERLSQRLGCSGNEFVGRGAAERRFVGNAAPRLWAGGHGPGEGACGPLDRRFRKIEAEKKYFFPQRTDAEAAYPAFGPEPRDLRTPSARKQYKSFAAVPRRETPACRRGASRRRQHRRETRGALLLLAPRAREPGEGRRSLLLAAAPLDPNKLHETRCHSIPSSTSYAPRPTRRRVLPRPSADSAARTVTSRPGFSPTGRGTGRSARPNKPATNCTMFFMSLTAQFRRNHQPRNASASSSAQSQATRRRHSPDHHVRPARDPRCHGHRAPSAAPAPPTAPPAGERPATRSVPR